MSDRFPIRKRLTDRETLRRADEIAARMQRAATRLPDEQRQERIERGRADDEFFLRTYLPHYFTAPFAFMHYELMKVMRLEGFTVFREPRGFGKTTQIQGLAIKDSLYGICPYQEFIGKSGDMGAELLLGIILELEENPRIQQDFGDVRSSIWSWEMGFRLKNGCWLDQIGRGEPVRGRKKGEHRPMRIVADDIEDEQLVRNPRRVKELIKWWLRAVLPSLAAGGTAIWLCTSLAHKSPSSLLLDPEYCPDEGGEPIQCRRLSFTAESKEANPDWQGHGMSVWPEFWPTERLRAQYNRIGRTAYLQEMMHVAEDAGGVFKPEWFKYYTEDQLPATELVTAAYTDPSARDKSTNDFKAVIVLSKHLPTDRYFVRRAWIRRESIPAMCSEMCEVAEKFDLMAMLLEANGFQQLVRYPLREEELRRRKRGVLRKVPVKEVEQTAPKEIRIRKLEAPFENGQFFFIKGHSDQDLLREQLEYFPASEDDGPDGLTGTYEYLRDICRSKPGRYYRVDGKSQMQGIV